MIKFPKGCHQWDHHRLQSGIERLSHKNEGISDMATKTFRRSPGGVNFWMFFRNSPELPPSSATVTMAVISTGFFLRLSRITEIPVPSSNNGYFRFSHERFTVSFRLSLSLWLQLTCQFFSKSCAKRSAKATERCWPPVQPMAMVRTDLPSRL